MTEPVQDTGFILQSIRREIVYNRENEYLTASHLTPSQYRNSIYIFLLIKKTIGQDNKQVKLLSATGFLLDVGQRHSPLSPLSPLSSLVAFWRVGSGWSWRGRTVSFLSDPVECRHLTRNWFYFLP